LWNPLDGQEVELPEGLAGNHKGMALSVKGLVGVWDETEDGFRLWDLSSARLLRTISDPKTATFLGNPITISLTPVEIAFADVDTAEITIWDLSSPVMGREAKRRDWEDVLFSHCGKFLASSTKDEVHEAIVDIWDAERGETSFRLNSGDIGSVICMTFCWTYQGCADARRTENQDTEIRLHQFGMDPLENGPRMSWRTHRQT
jgi:WD40 repeat protein